MGIFSVKELTVVNLLTPSLNKVLEIFKPEQIKEIIAKARKTKNINNDINVDVGAKFFEKKEHKLFLHFSCIPPKIRHNPLTEKQINLLQKQMNKWGIEDASVDLLKVTLNLKNILSLTKSLGFSKEEVKYIKESDKEFLATFIQETKLEPEVRDALEDKNEDLFHRLRFKRSLLVCRKLIPEKLIYSIDKEEIPHFIDLSKDWKEAYYESNFAPKMIAQQIIPQLNNYGYTRYYKESSTDRLEFVRGE